jgi:hypothetical protein
MGTLVTSMLRRESASISIAITSSPALTPVEVAERFSRGQTERPLISARPDGNPTAGGYWNSQLQPEWRIRQEQLLNHGPLQDKLAAQYPGND